MSETENTNQQNEKTFDLVLSLQDVNTVITSLNEAAFKLADPIIKKIIAQAQEQLPGIKANP